MGAPGKKSWLLVEVSRDRGALGHPGERRHRRNIQDLINFVVLPRAALEAS